MQRETETERVNKTEREKKNPNRNRESEKNNYKKKTDKKIIDDEVAFYGKKQQTKLDHRKINKIINI